MQFVAGIIVISEVFRCVRSVLYFISLKNKLKNKIFRNISIRDSWCYTAIAIKKRNGKKQKLKKFFPLYNHTGVRHSSYKDARGVAHSYFFSWEHAPTRNLEVDWLDARNICRRHCMDAVSLETPQVTEIDERKSGIRFFLNKIVLSFEGERIH